MDLAHSLVSPYVKASGASNTMPAVINSFLANGCLRAVDMGRSVTWPEALGTSTAVTVELLVPPGGRRLAGHFLRLWLNINQCCEER